MAYRGDTPVSGRGVRRGVPAAPEGQGPGTAMFRWKGSRRVLGTSGHESFGQPCMMHESTVVGLSGPCHHQPPTLPRPHTHTYPFLPLCTPASEISLDLSPSNMLPPAPPPIPTIRT